MNPAKQNRPWPDVALIIILALLPCLFFWRLLSPNPADRMTIVSGDFTEQYFPLRAFTAQSWVRGEIPLWNPYLFGGQPALADIQSGALYPPHVLESLLLGWWGVGFPLWALEWQVIAHFSLAAIGTYLFARSYFWHILSSRLLASSPPHLLRRARFGGVIASLVFTYGGYLTGFPVQQVTILEVSAWLPWVMWAVSVATRAETEDRRPETEDRRSATNELRLTPHASRLTLPRSPALYWGAFAFALAILAGHPQTVLYIFYLSLAYTLFSAFCEAWRMANGEWRTAKNEEWRIANGEWRTANNAPVTSVEPPLETPHALRSTPHALRSTPHAPRSTPHALRLLASRLISWLIIIILGSALAAAQLLPTREFIAHSLRADLSYQAVSAGLPLNEFISILYPGFFGGSPEYVGIVSLVFVALALTLALNSKSPTSNLQSLRLFQENKGPKRPETGDRRPGSHLTRSPVSRPPSFFATPYAVGSFKSWNSLSIFFWAGAALVSLLLAFGGNTFLYPLFYLLTPGFEAVRQQERAFLVYSFSAAVLAGYGAMVLTGPLAKSARASYTLFERRLRWLALIALALTAFFIYGSAASTARGDEVNLFYGVLGHHIFGLIILAGMLIALLLRPRRWLNRPWGMALVALWLAFNLFSVNWRFNLAPPPAFSPNGVIQFLQTNLPTCNLQPATCNLPTRIAGGGLLPGGGSAASVYKLQDLTGNTPLQLAAVENFMGQMPSWRLWQLLNVRYIIDQRNIADAGLKLVFEEGDLKAFEMGDPFPRAWFVDRVEVIAADDQAIARLAGDDFDLRRAAVVPVPLDLPPSDSTLATVNIVEFGANYLKAEVNASDRQLLVLSQIYYPGWQANLDGQAVPLLRVNVIQQGVLIPTGPHTLELTFSPRSFWLGLGLSGVALLICIILLGWKRR